MKIEKTSLGDEKILINTEKYLTKELFLREGYQTSFHYHAHKDETMYIVSGAGYIEFEERKEYFGKNDTIRIEPEERTFNRCNGKYSSTRNINTTSSTIQ